MKIRVQVHCTMFENIQFKASCTKIRLLCILSCTGKIFKFMRNSVREVILLLSKWSSLKSASKKSKILKTEGSIKLLIKQNMSIIAVHQDSLSLSHRHKSHCRSLISILAVPHYLGSNRSKQTSLNSLLRCNELNQMWQL